MNREQIENIKRALLVKSSDELIEIWIENDRDEWRDEAFIAIREILNSRRVRIPEQKRQGNGQKKPGNSPFQNREIRYGIACISSGILIYLVSLKFGDLIVIPSGLILFGIMILIKHQALK